MKDDIKEILDRIETASEIFDCLLKPKECTELLDYITNLQEENERLKTNWQVAQEDLEHILKLLGLELGDTIYDIENKILELQGEDK